MKTMDQKTLSPSQAFMVAKREPASSDGLFTFFEREEWESARRVLVENGYCPGCASSGVHAKIVNSQCQKCGEYLGE